MYFETIAKPDEKLHKIGFLAQELKQVLPEVVEDEMWVKTKDGSFKKEPSERKGVYYHEILPVVISTIKTHQTNLEDIKQQNHRIEELLKKLNN